MIPKRIGILGFDRLTTMHLAGPADAFAAAALEDGFGGRIPCYDVCLIGLKDGPFLSESGVTFRPAYNLRTAPELDTIIVPGGSGLRHPKITPVVSEWILSRTNGTRRIASVCTGIYGLAPTGLLDGREVTTHWRFASDVARRFPKLKVNHKRLLVKDGPFYTSAGLSAGVDLVLALVEEDYGPYVAAAVRSELVTYLARRNPNEESLSPVEYQSRPTERFGDLVAWMIRHLDHDLSVEALARRACICPSHFNRSFKSVFGSSPAAFVENLRLNEARRRLSKRNRTIHSIGASVGFKDPEVFRRAFERRFGVKPHSYLTGPRTTFAGREGNAEVLGA